MIEKILFNQSGLLWCADYLIGGQPLQTDKGRVIQDALELVDTLQKQADRFFVSDFLRNDIPRQRMEKLLWLRLRSLVVLVINR